MADENGASRLVPWVRIVALAGVAVLAVLVGRSVLKWRGEEVTRRQLELQKRRLVEGRALQKRKLVQDLVRDYLALQTKQWPRRDRMLEFIESNTGDNGIKNWAAGQRKKIAPMLKWLATKQRLLLEPGAPQPPPAATGAPPVADTGEAGAKGPVEEGDTPQWRSYAEVRKRLRLARGRLCCKITTGRILFSRADTMATCRRRAGVLCNALAKAAGEEQKCNYVVARECTSGEIIGGGDVTGAP
jgi:hypothetical protein